MRYSTKMPSPTSTRTPASRRRTDAQQRFAEAAAATQETSWKFEKYEPASPELQAELERTHAEYQAALVELKAARGLQAAHGVRVRWCD